MADRSKREDQKGSMDVAAQLKYLKAGYREEHKKNVKLQEEVANLTSELKRAKESLAEKVPFLITKT